MGNTGCFPVASRGKNTGTFDNLEQREEISLNSPFNFVAVQRGTRVSRDYDRINICCVCFC